MKWYEIVCIIILVLSAVGCWTLIRINHPVTKEAEQAAIDRDCEDLAKDMKERDAMRV